MEGRPEVILRDKENKIKLLFSEFESLKKKIFVCEQQRKEEAVSRTRHEQPRKASKYEQTRQSLQVVRQDSEKQLLKLKIDKYQQLLKQKADVFEDKEKYLNKALKQEKMNLEMMQETYERKLKRVAKISIPFTVQQVIGRLEFSNEVEDKLTTCQKRMSYLGDMVKELRKGIQLKSERATEELDEIIKEKLELEIAVVQKDEQIERLRLQIQSQQTKPAMQNDVMTKLDQIESERKQESRLLNLKIKELEDEIEQITVQRDNNKNQYEQAVARLERDFREELKDMSKKQEGLEQAEKTVSLNNSKLNQALREEKRLLQDTHIELTECRKQLNSLITQHEELRLKYETLSRQNKLSMTNYESQILTLKMKIETEKQEKSSLQQDFKTLQAQADREKKKFLKLESKVAETELKQKKNQKDVEQQTPIVHSLQQKLRNYQQQLLKEKNQHQSNTSLLQGKISSLNDRLEVNSTKLREKDEEINKLNSEIKKISAQKPGSNNVSMQTRKEIQKYQAEIEELKIILSATQQQLEGQQSGHSNKNTASMKVQIKQLTDDKGQLQKKLTQRDNQCDKYQKTIKKLEENQQKMEQRNKTLTTDLEDRQRVIEELKQKKAGFENLAFQISRGNDELKRKHMLEAPKTNEKRIASSINDIKIRQTKSDTEQFNMQERLDELQNKGALRQKSPQSKGKQSNMLYSINFTNQRHLQDRIKDLEKELELANVEKEFLKSKKLKLQQDINSFEVDQQRFQTQKEVLKQELNRLNQELNAIKTETKKLLTLLLVQNKKAFKGNITVLKDSFNKIFKMVLPGGELTLVHLFNTNLQEKKGIFSIL